MHKHRRKKINARKYGSTDVQTDRPNYRKALRLKGIQPLQLLQGRLILFIFSIQN